MSVVKKEIKYKTVTAQILSEIAQELGLQTLSRPYAALLDDGDLGLVLTFMPLLNGEYEKLISKYHEYIFKISDNRYGLVCFLPKKFITSDKSKVTEVIVYFNKNGNISKVEYKTEKNSNKAYEVLNPIRQQLLLNHAKKKKIKINKINN